MHACVLYIFNNVIHVVFKFSHGIRSGQVENAETETKVRKRKYEVRKA